MLSPSSPLARTARLGLGVALAALSFSIAAATPARPWPANPFSPLTAERIAELPASDRAAWQAYWDGSETLARQLPARTTPDASPLKPLQGPPKGGIHTKGLRLKEPSTWYASEEARTIADRVSATQMPIGAWGKGMDYTVPPPATPGNASGWSSATFDNDATIFELRFLARVISASGRDARSATWLGAFERGLRYVFAAQYPNGGFPQVYPLIGGYHDGITFNDDAMTQVLELLRDVAQRESDYAFVSPPLQAEAKDRLALGVRCVLATQLKGPDGQLTVWCQQYDPLTRTPSAARNFEPIADVSRESSAITVFLMSLPNPSPDIITAVDGAIAWFQATALRDLKVARAPADTRGEAIPSPGAPPLWSRFYEPGTTTPIFGDRDRTIHYDLREISPERIAGYTWYTEEPSRALARYATWHKKNPARYRASSASLP